MAEGSPPQVDLDAPHEERATLDAWVTGLPLDPLAAGAIRPKQTVVVAGRRALQAPGARAPRAAASVGGVDAGSRANWIPTGPRNITGRVRALAIHPTDRTIMYAGAASGGIFKSIDGGESWSPSWTDGASLSIAGIGICRDHPETVWVATGEIQAGGGEALLGSGIYRSTDSGATWTNAASPPLPGTGQNVATTFDGIAAHPTNAAVCWAVGPAGIFRTLDGGATWHQYDPGVYYSDVAFSFDTAAPPQPVVFLVRALSTAGEATVLRIDTPDDVNEAHIVAAVANAASASQPVPPPAAPLPPQTQWPARGKIAICAGTPGVAFARFAAQDDSHVGLFRTQNAQAAPVGAASAIIWAAVTDSVNNTDAGFAGEGQGGYNLSLAVNPGTPNEIATGMNDVYVSVNANGAAGSLTFKRAIAEDITFFDRAQHADQHTAIIVPPAAAGSPATLWVSNDGGISSSTDWQTGTGYPLGSTVLPLPAGVITWRKSFGISAAQGYSIAQSPLLPTAFGAGFQDNGVLLTSGGLTWRVVLGADGGFIDFDPDDPYKLLASYQSAIDEVIFPGKLEGGFALPGYPVREGLWPRDLTQGFLASDRPLFASDTAHHPRRSGRVLLGRHNRLYGSTETSGDRWQPEPAGRGFEIQLTVPASVPLPQPVSTLTVGPSPGAIRLGLPPQISVVTARPRQAAVASVRSMLPGPYALQNGDTLNLTLNGVARAIVFNRPAGQESVPWTAAEVAATIGTTVIAGVVGGVAVQAPLAAYPVFWARPWAVEVTTTELGPNAQITLGGSALTPLASGLAKLGLRARTYSGSAGRPASVTLIAPHGGMAPPAGQAALALTLKIGASGSTRTVTFDGDSFVDLAWIHAGELQRTIKAALKDDPATVTALSVEKRLRIAGTGGSNLQLGGTAAPRLNLPGWTPADPPAPALEPNVTLINSFDLSPPTVGPGAGVALVLTINDGAAKPSLTFNGTANDLRALTAEELEARLQAHFTANAVNASCTLELVHDSGEPTEITYSRTATETAWVGSSDGTLLRTANDGGRWDTIQEPLIYGLDRNIEAIAIHPKDTSTVYVGLEGRPTGGIEDQAQLTKNGLLFKTTDNGSSWSHIGGDVKDSNGGLLGVYALQIDPAEPDTVFAATEVGVFRSTNAGSNWQPFNEGLPNAIVRDLDFVPERRVLRASVWGRGTFERQVGSSTPKDVDLYIRASDLDDGSVRPVPRGPDIYAPAPRLLRPAASPDVKHSRDDPPSIAGVTAIDGVEFDDDILHEEIATGNATVFVQVHNRGAFPATAVRAVVLWADAAGGPPPLPADFWASFHAKTLAANVGGGWSLIGDTVLVDPAAKGRDRVPSGYPRVLRFGVNWPADIATHRTIGVLVLVECAEDPLGATLVDVGDLLDAEPQAAYREARTVADRDDRTIRLEQTDRTQFTVSAPAGPLAPATAVLAPGAVLPLGPVNGLTGDTQAAFALAPVGANNQALIVSVPPQAVTVTFAGGIFNPAAARIDEVARIIEHDLFKAGVPVSVDPVAQNAGTLTLQGGGGAIFQVTGGTAAANLGLAVGAPAAARLAGGPAPFNLSAGAPQTLVLSVTNQATIQFGAQPGFNPAAAPARAIRRLLNRELAAAALPIRAVVPHVELWVRRSITDIDGVPSPVAGRQLADLVAAPAAVAAAGQAALFDLVHIHGPAPVRPANDNFLYLRATNLGNVDLASADSRHRLFAVAIAASPLTTTQIGAAAGIQQLVPARSSTIVEFHWNPGPAATGDRLFVLAVVDDQTNSALAVPATFATVDDLDRFCTANPNAAYRMFVVGT